MDAAFAALLVELGDEAATPVVSVAPITRTETAPRLSSRLSASGTDFSSRALRRVASVGDKRHMASSLGPVPVGDAEPTSPPDDDLSPQPKPTLQAADMRHRRVHLNELSSLSVKQRRLKQPLQLQASSEELVEAASAFRSLADDGATFPPVEPLPVTPSASPGPPRLADSLGRQHSVANQLLPPSEVVLEALTGNATPTSSPQLTRSSKRASSTHGSHRRGGSVPWRKFKTVFPGGSPVNGAMVRQESSVANLLVDVDGGFGAHARDYGQPLFAPALLYVVETHPLDEDEKRAPSTRWAFAPDALRRPSLFERPFERHCSGPSVRPRLWVWKRGLTVIAAVPEREGTAVRVVLHAPGGSQNVLLELQNVNVLAPTELFRQMIAQANPLVPLEECVRVRGNAGTVLKESVLQFERRLIPQCVEVALVRVCSADVDENRQRRRTSWKQSAFERFVTLLAGHECATEGATTYTWADCAVRVSFVSPRHLVQAEHRLVVAFVEGREPLPPLDGPCVVLAVRECDTKAGHYWVACSRRANVPVFGPPVFAEPLKDKHVHAVLSCKLWNAYATLRTTADAALVSSDRAALLRHYIDDACAAE